MESSPLFPSDPYWMSRSASLPSNVSEHSERWRDFQVRLRYYVPVVGWLPKYPLGCLQKDVLAGITVAFLIIPQSLSYAQALVHVPPIYGLYSAFIPLLIYSLLGTSKQLAVGPEALVSILVGATVKEFVTWRDSVADVSIMSMGALVDDTTNIKATALLCLLIGIFTFLLGFFRLGFLDSVLSRALLRGFVLAVAMVVMIDMSETLLGQVPPTDQCGFIHSMTASQNSNPNPSEESPMSKLWDVIVALPSKTHLLTTLISTCSIGFLLGVKALKRLFKSHPTIQLVPEILILVLTTTILSKVLRWDCQGVAILNVVSGNAKAIDTIPVPTLAKVRYLLLSAILISVIGFVESIVVAKTYATKHNYSISPNRELVALGVSNICSSFFGAFPAFGSLGRSAVNDGAGAQSQVAGFTTGVIVWMTSVWLLPYFQFLPKAVCSSIIVVAALKLIELEDVMFIIKVHAWTDLGLLVLTFMTTLFISIESGTLISVGVSLLLVVKHTTKTRLAIVGQTWVMDPQSGQIKTKFRSATDEEGGPVERIDGGLVIRIEEGMFFGNVGHLRDRLKRIELHGELGVHPGEEPRRRTRRVQVPAVEVSDVISEFGDPVEEMIVDHFVEEEECLKSVIFDMSAVSEMDASAVQTLYEIVEEYNSRRIMVCFVKLRESCRLLFQRAGLVDLAGHDHFFRKIRDAVGYLQSQNAIDVIDNFPSPASNGSHYGTIPPIGIYNNGLPPSSFQGSFRPQPRYFVSPSTGPRVTKPITQIPFRPSGAFDAAFSSPQAFDYSVEPPTPRMDDSEDDHSTENGSNVTSTPIRHHS